MRLPFKTSYDTTPPPALPLSTHPLVVLPQVTHNGKVTEDGWETELECCLARLQYAVLEMAEE